MEELHIPETLEITNMEKLKAISDPLRFEILKQIGLVNRKGERCTVKQLGKLLKMPPTKLYYHVNILEEHELLVVGETQVVSGIIEKHYQVCAMHISVSQDLMAMENQEDRQGQLNQIIQSIQDLANSNLQNLRTSLQTIYDEAKREKEGGPPAQEQIAMDVSSNELLLTREQAKEFILRLTELHKEYDEISNNNLNENVADGLFFGYFKMLVPYYHRKPQADQSEDEN